MATRLLITLLLLFAACGREGEPSTTAAPSPSDAPAASPSPFSSSATPSLSASASAAAPTGASGTPAAPSGCRNSTRASCGPLRFDPEPDDDPVAVRVSFAPRSPKAGDTVTFTLRATDPDSGTVDLGTYDFGPRGTAHIARGRSSACTRGYGPWTPPAAKAGSASDTLTHTYATAGTYEATFTFLSRSGADGLPGDDEGRCVDPYAGSGKADVVVVVR